MNSQPCKTAATRSRRSADDDCTQPGAYPSRRGDRGMALLIVIGFLAVVTLMVSHVATVTMVGAREARILVLRREMRFAAESAAARAYWLFLCDRRTFPADHSNLMAEPAPRLLGERVDSWRANGRVHKLENGSFSVEVVLRDADTGLDLSGTNPVADLRRMSQPNDEEQMKALNRVYDELMDYVDADDFQRLYGRERDEYEADGLFLMPRNGPLQLREEALWLQDFRRHFLKDAAPDELRGLRMIRVIPPPGQRFPKSVKPSLFSSDPLFIRQFLGLPDDQLLQILESRNKYVADGVSVADSLPPELYSQLMSKFSVQESGVAIFEVTVFAADKEVSRSYRLVRDANPAALQSRSGTARVLVNWEKLVE